MRMRGVRPHIILLLPVFLLFSGAFSSQAQAPGGVGDIAGRVTDLQGRPLAYANVMVVGTQWGAFSLDDGTFVIRNLPVGTYNLAVNMIGYEDQSVPNVTVTRGETSRVEFRIADKPVGTMPLVEIVASREVIKRSRTDISHQIGSEDVSSLPVDEMSELISLKAGVIARGGQLHFRGGRAGEVQYQVDGVPVRDPLVGGGVGLAALAVQSTEMIMGGLDAKYGNAQSGVVNFTTKEGGDRFSGEVHFLTDNYGQPKNTYDNLHRIFVGAGGPSPIRNMTYYLSAEGTFQDNYPRTIRRKNRDKILNFISVGDRKSNQIRYQGKLAFRPAPSYKLTAEYIRNRSRSHQYYHLWSRDGYVETYYDTTQTGDVVRRRGRWSPTQVDSTYEYYNAAEHTPDFISNFDRVAVILNHTIDQNTFYTMRLNRNSFFNDARVRGKEAWEYDGSQYRDYWYNYNDNTTSDFYVVSGDYPSMSTRNTAVYTVKGDLVRRHDRHTFETGFEGTYNDMRYQQVDYMFNTNSLGEIGTRTRYHYFNPEGAVYVQDRWEHEGMVLNFGLRYDVFSVGQQLPVSEVRDRTKQQVSPRIGIAYPISDRDVFTFHYGRFYQIPDRQYIFDNRTVFDGRIRGNPNLTNETTVSYQAGIQHLFSETVSGQFSVYYKDVFGQLTAEEMPALGTVGTVATYANKDYASARGFETTLSKRFSNNFGGEINYGFGVATGVASDPNAAAVQDFTYLPISEQPLNWDVRHTISVQLMIAEPGNWLTSFVWEYLSGFPYTPWGRDTRELNPASVNSRRLPSTTSLDVQAEKYYRVWGQRFRVFLQSRNVLDSKNITNLSPGNWPSPPGRSDTDYATYFTETGRAGGAYLGTDVTGDGKADWVPVHDPRVFGDPRSVRVGLQYSF